MSEAQKKVRAAGNEDTAGETQKDTQDDADKGGKFQLIRNPLTIIGAFAAIAEGAGAAVLPLIDKSLQSTYIWFIIGFPTLLVILFFATLNFNNEVLYGPGDFKEESNYVKFITGALSKKNELKLAELERSVKEITEKVKEVLANSDSDAQGALEKIIDTEMKSLNDQISEAKKSVEKYSQFTEHLPSKRTSLSLLSALSDGEPRTAGQLSEATGLKLSSVIKELSAPDMGRVLAVEAAGDKKVYRALV
jgi:DNA-binding transcriptional ArsR family regulator